jgi:predicted alpha/beta hydrolase
MKWAPDPATFKAPGLLAFARLTGSALARAHARAGDPVPIAAYLGQSDRADRAFADFAVSYADQAELDYAEFADAIREGRLEVSDTF